MLRKCTYPSALVRPVEAKDTEDIGRREESQLWPESLSNILGCVSRD